MPAKLRYHHEREKDGLMIFEYEPQVRTLFIYASGKSSIRLPLPYLQFVIRYLKYHTFDLFGKRTYPVNGPAKYVYPGIYGCGMRLYCRNTPINSLSSEVFVFPTDLGYGGSICTPHEHDNKAYMTPLELGKTAMNYWWSMMHQFEYYPKDDRGFISQWEKMSVDEVLKVEWDSFGPLRDALRIAQDGLSRRFSATVEDVALPVSGKVKFLK